MQPTYKSGICLVLGLFAIIYARSLTFVYIEGDDATSIAYHALGRNAALEPPYSAYQSMMDTVLGVLPPKEPVLRVSAMLITAIAAPVLVLLIGLLAFEWAGELAAVPWALGAIFIPLAAPELVFLGLVYTPALLAMSAAVGAHVVVRRALTRRKQGWRDRWLWGAAVLLGAGVACRWDMAAYGAVVAADIWLGPRCHPSRPETSRPGAPRWAGHEATGSGRTRMTLAAVWGNVAAATWLVAVALNGYGPGMVWKAIRASGPMEATPGLLVAVATAQTLVTPAMGLLALAGFALLLKRRHRLTIPVVVGIVLTARFARFGVPKWFLAAVPGIATCALIGLSAMWQHWRRGWKAIGVRMAIGAVILVPWVIGVQTVFGDSAYGPGFEVQPFDRPAPGHRPMRAAIGAGALVPTSEGPRPAGGYGWVLVGGGWREIAGANAAELNRAIREAITTGRPLLQDEGDGYATATLAGMNFTTRDNWNHKIDCAFLVERRFSSADGRSTRVLRLRDRGSLFAAADVSRLRRLAEADTVVIFGYTSTLRQCYRLAPDSLTKLGARSAQLNLDRLEEQLVR